MIGRVDFGPKRAALLMLVAAWSMTLIFGAPAASDRRAPPAGAFPGAPGEFTRFTGSELSRGFLALAFGSDLRLGATSVRLHRFERPVRIFIQKQDGEQHERYLRIVDEFALKFPRLSMHVVDDPTSANVVVHLIKESEFTAAIESAFGRETARAFIAKTDPQCMTSVQSEAKGPIVHVDSFVIVDQGDAVFFNCAYHEMLHVLGLSNHDQSNPWTALNQNRTVGYLTVYDRALLEILYDSRLRAGMTRNEVRRRLPLIAKEYAGAL
jgi:hypothetical protein